MIWSEMITLEDIVGHVRCRDWCGPVFDDANTGFTRTPLCGDTGEDGSGGTPSSEANGRGVR